jgi:hypothetical protein
MPATHSCQVFEPKQIGESEILGLHKSAFVLRWAELEHVSYM